jgi:hypothetical protein
MLSRLDHPTNTKPMPKPQPPSTTPESARKSHQFQKKDTAKDNKEQTDTPLLAHLSSKQHANVDNRVDQKSCKSTTTSST